MDNIKVLDKEPRDLHMKVLEVVYIYHADGTSLNLNDGQQSRPTTIHSSLEQSQNGISYLKQ